MICTSCGLEKKIHGNDLCIPCYHKQPHILEKKRTYYKLNKEKMDMNNKENYYKNREKILLRKKKNYDNNPRFILDRNKTYKLTNPKYTLDYYYKNKDIIIEKRKRAYESNKEKILQRNKEKRLQDMNYNLKRRINYNNNKDLYNLKRREPYKLYMRNRLKNDLNFRLYNNLRSRVLGAIRRNNNIKSKRTLELLGCDVQFFRNHIEKQFDENMSWENYGTYWEIDHIVPCAHFILSEPEQQELCFNYTNCQPLEIPENRSKQDAIEEEELICLIN